MNAYHAAKRLLQLSFGIYSAPTVVTSSAAATGGKWACFQAVSSDCVVSSITIQGTAITAFSAITLAQGQCIYGNITAASVSAGTGMLYGGDLAGLE